MRNYGKGTVTEAAKLVGIGRQQLYRGYINSNPGYCRVTTSLSTSSFL
ncbi:helix-turn-helix domain-containing protein [Acidithiobacillus sp.]